MSTEKEREAHVYMAKLAEQAERYDGMTIFCRMHIGICVRFFCVSESNVVGSIRVCISQSYAWMWSRFAHRGNCLYDGLGCVCFLCEILR